MKWRHARMGLIEGNTIRDDGVWVDIQLFSEVRLSNAPVGWRFGVRPLYARAGEIITVRKTLLKEATE